MLVRGDGLVFVDPNNPLDPANNPGAASTSDDLNPDAVGFGVKNIQASEASRRNAEVLQAMGMRSRVAALWADAK